ncbi:iron-sulfur cluster repair di-iron protein [Sphingobacteriaceae bacterium]|nr:iron-sulfur cluster repair di-iron protein [Sphingobacteriaceae bacterium]
MNTTKEKTIGEIVADDYRTAAVFESFGIDFCCKGNKMMDEVCASNNISRNVLELELKKVKANEANQVTDYKSWPLDLLTDFIEKKHHRYVEDKTPVLKQYLDKICTVHGKNHPELFEIKELFNQSAGELAAHMKKEELILFPFVRKLAHTRRENQASPQPSFGTVQNPITMMMHEHDTEGEIFRQIAKLSNNYTPPLDACNTYKVTFALLKEFEADLHLHIHLENNILFPKSIEMEKSNPQ